MYPSLNKKHRRILQGSILLSVCLHLISLAFLQRQSLWFAAPLSAQKKAVPWVSSMDKQERDLILKESFARSSSPHTTGESQASRPAMEVLEHMPPKPIALPPIESGFQFLSSLTPSSPFPENELLTSNRTLSFHLPPEERIDLFEHLPRDLIVLTPSHPTSSLIPMLPPPPLATQTTLEATAIPSPPEVCSATAVSQSASPLKFPSLPEASILAKAPAFIPSIHLPQLPSLEDLQTISYSDAFETELVFSPKEGGGYIFALTLIPRADLQLTPLRQNYLFLIDRSNSIQQGRLAATKTAVRKALEEIQAGDTFNIFVFDSKVEKLSSTPLHFSPETLTKAGHFLDQMELGSFFSQADLFKPLFLTIPSNVNEDELYTAILLTDGESLSKKGIAHSLLCDWTFNNDGRISLYSVCMNGDPHLPVLDAASAFNRGKVFSSPTHRGIKRKLLKLMKTIQTPVAKNLSCKAISRTPRGSIEIFPKSPSAPHLYLNEPYIVVGETESLDDFILFVQGRLNGEWLHIKKTISFLNGKKGGSSLKAEWALQKTYGLYEQYFTDDNPNHLAEAKSLLEPLHLKAPFE